jgi:hypothetical protein
MARYQIPPDPRKRESDADRKDRDLREPVPWRWLGMGVVVTIVGIFLAINLARAFLDREPLPVTPLSPTIVVLTAPATTAPQATAALLPPTSVPTVTSVPTPDLANAPEEVTLGFYAAVANTEGFGVTIRGGPSTNNVAITVADEGALLLVLDGPQEGNGFLWWQVRMDDGTEGWAASDFLIPAVGPGG